MSRMQSRVSVCIKWFTAISRGGKIGSGGLSAPLNEPLDWAPLFKIVCRLSNCETYQRLQDVLGKQIDITAAKRR